MFQTTMLRPWVSEACLEFVDSVLLGGINPLSSSILSRLSQPQASLAIEIVFLILSRKEQS